MYKFNRRQEDLRVPFIEKKRYLTGIDWVINTFDRLLKKRTGAGNASQIILALDGPLNEPAFLEDIHAFSQAIPILRGRVRRDINLAPYWKVPRKSLCSPIPFTTETLAEPCADAVPFSLADHVNDPFPNETTHLAFHAVHSPDGRAWLSMVFDHRLFDARGAEGFLVLFDGWRASRDLVPILREIPCAEPAHLSQWRRKFKAGQIVNRTLRAAAEFSYPLTDFTRVESRETRFRFLDFTEKETAAIEALAYEEAGFLMLSPFLLAVCLQTLHQALERQNRALPAYVIPVSMDRRQSGAWRSSLFFNHLSFLFLSARSEIMQDRRALIEHLLLQIYDQTRQRVQDCYMEAAMLMRIAPLSLMGQLARLPLKGGFGTFPFSFLGDTLLDQPAFMDQPLAQVWHGPRVPIPPGLGFFFNLSRKKLNLTLAYIPELLDEEALDIIEQTMRAALVPEP